MNRAFSPPDRGRPDQRGIALVAAILLLLLTSVLAATFIATTTSERAISSNVHVARASLVAADAGVRVAQQIIANVGKTKLDSCAAVWPGGNTMVVGNFNLFKSGPYTVTSTNPPFSASATVSFEDTTGAPGTAQQLYDYAYTITATGGFGAEGSRTVQSQGILRLSAQRQSFADFLVFTNTHLTPGGGAIWFSSGTRFDGRVHTNGEFRFAFQPQFQDLVTSVNSKAWYNNSGSPIELNANNNGNTDKPDFFGGFQRSQPSVTLPANSYNQQGAALATTMNGLASAPTNTQINQAIVGPTGGSGALPNGVYVPTAGTGAATGGIYVQGGLDSLVMFPSGNNQVYRFRQSGKTYVLTVDMVNGTGGTLLIPGTPPTLQSFNGTPNGSVFVNGGISALGGPPRAAGVVQPAIQSSNALTITATNDIVIQRDITCQDYNGGTNVLGLYSSGGNVRVGTSAPADCNVDAFVMATGTTAAFQVDNYNSGSQRGTFHLRGGMVSSYYGPFGTFDASNGQSLTGYNRDFHYDKRGFKPPFYPTTNRYGVDIPTARTLSWKEM